MESETASARFHTGLLSDIDWNGTWIGHTTVNMNEIRKEFSIPSSETISSAYAYISGIGYYELSFNGMKVDEDRKLDPGWTTYEKRVLYASFDVASLLHTGSNAIEFSSTASVLYGYNQETTDFGFRRMTVDASGVSITNVTQNLISGFGVDIEYDGGRIYTTTGRVINPEAATLLGTFATSGSLEPVSSRGLTYFLNGAQLQAFDQANFTLVRSLTVPGITGSSPGLIHWGSTGLAFLAGGKLFLVDWDARNPQTSPAHVVNLTAGQTVLGRDFGNAGADASAPVITSNGRGYGECQRAGRHDRRERR